MKCFWAVGLMVGLLMVLPAAAQIAEVGAAELNNASIEISLSKAPSAAWMQPVLPVVASAAKVQTVPEAHQVFLDRPAGIRFSVRSEEHTSELQSRLHLVCRLLLE